eukprot:CAMPEP_0171710538 /NCGR_PEP_ID=MMETSP0991-20121206/16062_1 /TAXON_ID=483369 /ORGANISM="non described non described, Strain CCMP2098" /LENGTH=842 /DNA_ID=CAMNT_0012300713 /DNA_START=225 /DNA_END=2750 /DNA_ORIENTATION=+
MAQPTYTVNSNVPNFERFRGEACKDFTDGHSSLPPATPNFPEPSPLLRPSIEAGQPFQTGDSERSLEQDGVVNHPPPPPDTPTLQRSSSLLGRISSVQSAQQTGPSIRIGRSYQVDTPSLESLGVSSPSNGALRMVSSVGEVNQEETNNPAWSDELKAAFAKAILTHKKDLGCVARAIGVPVKECTAHYYRFYKKQPGSGYHALKALGPWGCVDEQEAGEPTGSGEDSCVECGKAGELFGCDDCDNWYCLVCTKASKSALSSCEAWYCPDCTDLKRRREQKRKQTLQQQQEKKRVKKKSEEKSREQASLKEKTGGGKQRQWAQCDKCKKRRRLLHGVDAAALPELWFCSMGGCDVIPGSCSTSPEEVNEEVNELQVNSGKSGSNSRDAADESSTSAFQSGKERRGHRAEEGLSRPTRVAEGDTVDLTAEDETELNEEIREEIEQEIQQFSFLDEDGVSDDDDRFWDQNDGKPSNKLEIRAPDVRTMPPLAVSDMQSSDSCLTKDTQVNATACALPSLSNISPQSDSREDYGSILSSPSLTSAAFLVSTTTQAQSSDLHINSYHSMTTDDPPCPKIVPDVNKGTFDSTTHGFLRDKRPLSTEQNNKLLPSAKRISSTGRCSGAKTNFLPCATPPSDILQPIRWIARNGIELSLRADLAATQLRPAVIQLDEDALLVVSGVVLGRSVKLYPPSGVRVQPSVEDVAAFNSSLAAGKMISRTHTRFSALLCKENVHAKLAPEAGSPAEESDDRMLDIWVEDLASTNGTWVDGEMLEPHVPRRVIPGTRVQFGQPEFNLDYTVKSRLKSGLLSEPKSAKTVAAKKPKINPSHDSGTSSSTQEQSLMW